MFEKKTQGAGAGGHLNKETKTPRQKAGALGIRVTTETYRFCLWLSRIESNDRAEEKTNHTTAPQGGIAGKRLARPYGEWDARQLQDHLRRR